MYFLVIHEHDHLIIMWLILNNLFNKLGDLIDVNSLMNYYIIGWKRFFSIKFRGNFVLTITASWFPIYYR